MKDFLIYFLGQGDTPEFANFTAAHFIPVLLLIGVIVLIRVFRDPLQQWKHEKAIRYFLAFALILSEMSYYWRLVALPGLGPNPTDHLPITVCGWVGCSPATCSSARPRVCLTSAISGCSPALFLP